MSDKALPLLLVKTGQISKRDKQRAEKVGFICIIECADPDAARFVEPPVNMPIDARSRAALKLARKVMSERGSVNSVDLVRFFVDALMNEQPPQQVPAVKPANVVRPT